MDEIVHCRSSLYEFMVNRSYAKQKNEAYPPRFVMKFVRFRSGAFRVANGELKHIAILVSAALSYGGMIFCLPYNACIFVTLSLLIAGQAHAQEMQRFNIGQPATAREIAAWDIDVRPDGEGLPVGQGEAATGRILYQAKCERCHGAEGVGGPFGSLVGRLPGDEFPFGRDASVEKTVGNYWPYATTVFDYIRRAMPFDAPGSLGDDDVYSLVTFLLQENQIVAPGVRLNQDNLADIKMPSRDRFVPDDRRGGGEIR